MEMLNLIDFGKFCSHPWLEEIRRQFKKDSTLSQFAVARLVNDLGIINEKFKDENEGRALFTSITGRIKDEDSMFKKLHKLCRERRPDLGLTQETFFLLYLSIKDIGGVRFSCPYLDEIEPAIYKKVRLELAELGYATDLQMEASFTDKNLLDKGDEFGYRSYHFYIRVPTVIDIYGKIELCLCEVQARSELQHIWAVKSHDLIYKNKKDIIIDEQLKRDMKEINNLLRATDEFLVSIRNRLQKKLKI